MDDTARIILTAVISALSGGLLGGGVVYGVVFGAMVNKLRDTFVTRPDAEALVKRRDEQVAEMKLTLHRLEHFAVQHDDRIGTVEKRSEVLEERQTQQWGRIAEQMTQTAKALDRATERQEEIGSMLHDLALQIERIHRERR